MNLATNLEASAYFFPDCPAVRQDGSETSYAQLNAQANTIATSLLKMGVKAGEPVGLCAPNSAEWIAFYYGVLKSGAIAVTLSAVLAEEELATLASHSRVRFLLAHESRLKDLDRLKSQSGVEKVICAGGDLELGDLMKTSSGSFKAIERDREDKGDFL